MKSACSSVDFLNDSLAWADSQTGYYGSFGTFILLNRA